MTSTNYHATPYDITAAGFYFHDYEDYEAKARTHRNDYGEVVEEFEIQFIDGDNYQLFNALGINQANLEQWFEDFEDMQGTDVVAAIYLAEYLNVDMADIIDKLDGVSFYVGHAKTYAEDYLSDSGLLDEVPESLRYYMDVDAFARDMLLAGDITEIDIMGATYVFWDC